ncbi:MAG: hypothetical protein AB7S81_03545 [Bdellovibrionales bacterium]
MAQQVSPTAGTVISAVKILITESGLCAFECGGRTLLYSGPEREIRRSLRILGNHDRAFAQTHDLPVLPLKMIDQTKVGRWLDKLDAGRGIYTFFSFVYNKDPEKARFHADQVMRFVSREFAKTCYGDIETAVCGADLNNVFFEVELPELIRNDKIKTINKLPMQRIRDIYLTQGAYVAHREICKAELQLLKDRENSPCGEEIKQDRKDRFKFFRKACKETFKKIKARERKVMEHLGPNRPHVMTGKPIRTMAPKAPYQALSVQYG